jgi:hypothetical protein
LLIIVFSGAICRLIPQAALNQLNHRGNEVESP